MPFSRYLKTQEDRKITMTKEEQSKKLGQIITKTWEDETFK